MQIIDGKAIAAEIKKEIAAEVNEIIAKGGKRPHLAAILVCHVCLAATVVSYKEIGRASCRERVSRCV